MKANDPSGQETDGCTDLEVTVCANGVVNVRRPESERAHSVMLDERGDAVRCSCKGYKFRGECTHADAIERRPLVTTSAQAAASAPKRVATDGGRVETADDDATILHGRECPRSERHDGDGLRKTADELADESAEADGGHENATCEECGAEADTRFDADITHGRGCSQARGVVDPYADEEQEVDTTPL